MKVRKNTQIKKVYERFPSSDEVFSYHSIELDDDGFEMTLEEITAEYDVDLEEFLVELQTHIDEEMDDEEDEEDEEEFDEDDEDAPSPQAAAPNLDDASLAESPDDEDEDEGNDQ
jgi:hypothetical protein